MKNFKDFLNERCWPGYRPVSGKKAFSKGSCVKEDGMSAAPTNVVSGGAIAGSGGLGGEPGVKPKSKKTPVMMKTLKRKTPKV
jgi:hypothetical protein